MLCFAYGSNMNWHQMRERCPSTRFVGVALLPDHKLAFTRKSENRECGVADALPEADHEIWGVVYQIDERDLGPLDSSEGYKPGRKSNSYFRRECHVLLDGEDTKPLVVFTYFADPEPNPPLPNTEYRNLILSGARHWHLPAEYIAELEQIEVEG
ncbi:MAG: hypothetical protein A2139_06480 [Desulfobacca sp. RBG_16_60_12]|nr:MAG: hypothetical protein A2139_06480 [Desulfobacca sp. RBG_16_60_12]